MINLLPMKFKYLWKGYITSLHNLEGMDDNEDTSKGHSRERLKPNVYIATIGSIIPETRVSLSSDENKRNQYYGLEGPPKRYAKSP